MEYLTVMRPQSVIAQGIFDMLERGLQGLCIQEVSAEHCGKLVSIGASANIAAQD